MATGHPEDTLERLSPAGVQRRAPGRFVFHICGAICALNYGVSNSPRKSAPGPVHFQLSTLGDQDFLRSTRIIIMYLAGSLESNTSL